MSTAGMDVVSAPEAPDAPVQEIVYPNGARYWGQVELGATGHCLRPHGQGSYYRPRSATAARSRSIPKGPEAAPMYTGQWVAGMHDGIGTLALRDGSTWTGRFRRGSRHGFGVHRPAGSEGGSGGGDRVTASVYRGGRLVAREEDVAAGATLEVRLRVWTQVVVAHVPDRLQATRWCVHHDDKLVVVDLDTAELRPCVGHAVCRHPLACCVARPLPAAGPW